jgi:CheY-like chemotaxis protein
MAVIVAAEDDVDVADLLAATLCRAGHVVHVAGTGPRALQMVAEWHPDLVILDHNMPGMTGLDVARRLRADESTASLPILMLSAAAPDDARDVFDQVMQMPVGLRSVADAAGDLIAASRHDRPAGRPLTDLDRLHAVAALLGAPEPVDDLTLTLLMSNVAEAAGCRTAATALVLNDTVVAAAAVGLPDLILEAGGVPIEWSPCGVVVGGDRPVLIRDMRNDPIFRDTVLSTLCGVRSYAAVPLRTEAGLVIGALTVMDTGPDRFTATTVRGLIATTPAVLEVLNRRRDRP